MTDTLCRPSFDLFQMLYICFAVYLVFFTINNTVYLNLKETR